MQNDTKVFQRVIDEIKDITATNVAKKQDAAKLNFPKILEQIKQVASLGESVCLISVAHMNEYDKKLLVEEGFNVQLIDKVKDKYYELAQYLPGQDKIWQIKW